jgi:hypothetical protein
MYGRNAPVGGLFLGMLRRIFLGSHPEDIPPLFGPR